MLLPSIHKCRQRWVNLACLKAGKAAVKLMIAEANASGLQQALHRDCLDVKGGIRIVCGKWQFRRVRNPSVVELYLMYLAFAMSANAC